jgi:hypothetical protein
LSDENELSVANVDRLISERDDYKTRWEILGRVARNKIDRLEAQLAKDHMRESRIARAGGLAQAIAECRDDARLDGIRECAAEIAELLRARDD